jgi:molecular chaperone DnaJ
MSDRPDLYAIMGVPRTATEEDIRAAYRRLALKWHPDRNPGDQAAESRFREIREAYDTLSDADKRRAYDLGGRPANGGFRQAGAGVSVSVESFLGPIEDALGAFIAGIFGTSAGLRGADVVVRVTLGMKEAVAGVTKDFDIACRETCPACGGAGRVVAAKPGICVHCAGSGVMETGAGFISIRHTCHHCDGTGWTGAPTCRGCGGLGLVGATRPVALSIPAGVRDGTRLRFAGQGEPAARGGRRGDLYCEVRVRLEATA